MGAYEDLAGKTYGRLVVLEEGKRRGGNRYVLCRCDCGIEKTIQVSNLKSGATISCGCLGRERRLAALTKHGMTRTRLHKIWTKMRERCLNPNADNFSHYGGRGITICNEWFDFKTFCDWAFTSGYGGDLTIDRKDNEGNYCPENCRWVTQHEQCRNRRSNVVLEWNGRIQCATTWAEEVGMPPRVLLERIRNGWGVEDALTRPPRITGSQRSDQV